MEQETQRNINVHHLHHLHHPVHSHHLSFSERNSIPVSSILLSSFSDTDVITQILPHYHPTFYIFVDDITSSVILLLRGTMSMNDLLTDLSCKLVPFLPPTNVRYTFDSFETEKTFIPGNHLVHSGMYKAAQCLVRPESLLIKTLAEALLRYPNYELVLIGHSLGAGVCSLLSLLLADPSTCRTINNTGLPEDRVFSCFAVSFPIIPSKFLTVLFLKDIL